LVDKDTLRRVREGLDHLQAAIHPFVSAWMAKKFGPRWVMYASRAQGSSALDNLDLYGLLKTMIDQWRDVFDEAFARNDKFRVRNFLSTCFEARNNTSHLTLPLTDEEGLRYLDAMLALASALKAPDKELAALKALYAEQRQDGVAPLVAAAPNKVEAGTLSLGLDEPDQPVRALKPWTEVAFPHPDVLENRYKQSEFAADLAAVDLGHATGDYAKPDDFFRITFLTEGLQRVLRTALARLSGQGGDPILGLQTSFGGGKTHTMLALYHVAQARDLNLLEGVRDLAEPGAVSAWKPAKTAVFVGTAKGVDSDLMLRDGPKVRTLWGFIAWKLAGEAGLDLVRESEAAGTNPGSELMVEVFRLAGPSVVLLDEVVAFARQLPDERFEAFLSFIQSLTEAAKMVPNILVVGSLPESDVEAGGQKGIEALHRLEKVFGRVGSPWLAAHGDETYEIVRRRLFQQLDAEGEKARDETVRAFHDLYRKNPSEFPAFAKEARYGELLRISYPIHPELFERLSKDWSTLPNFQRTRGVLRLMADVVSVLWQQRTRDPLILPARIPLAEQRIKASITYPLNPAFSAVLDSEVDGDGSLPARMESVTTRRISQARAATRAARAVFLCSAPTVGQPNAGVNGLSIRLAAAEPGDQLAIFGEALRELHERATYLYEDAGRYWFSTQPTLNRLADERARALEQHVVDEEIVRVLQTEAGARGGFSRVYAAPDDPATVDEAPALALVILKPEAAHSKGATSSPAIDAVSDALSRCRTSQRRYRNTLIFAAADEAALATAREVVRKALGWQSIDRETEKGDLRKQLTQGQIDDVRERAKITRDAAEKAIRAAWTHLLYAVKDETALDGRPFDLAQTTLLARDRSSIAVSAYEKLSPKGDSIVKEQLGPKILLARLGSVWPETQPHLAISELREWFAAYVYLPKLRDPAVLESAIAEGVSGSDPQFGYAEGIDETGHYRGLVYGRMAPTVFSSDAHLVRSSVAKAQLDQVSQGTPTPPPKPGELPGANGAEAAPVADLPGPIQPTRFFGSVELDTDRPIRSFESVFNAVVALLQNAKGAKVKLTLEIEAEAPDGFTEADVRDVRDNSKQLKFRSESTGFE
jgi:predicted AAA+ superfamily ATPase